MPILTYMTAEYTSSSTTPYYQKTKGVVIQGEVRLT